MNTLLAVAENVSRVGAINALVARLADRIAPKAIAQACGGVCVIYTGGCYNHQQEIVRGMFSWGGQCAGPFCTEYYGC